MNLINFEIAGFIGALIFGVVWFFDPTGNWEPLVAMCGFSSVAVEISRRITKQTLKGRFESDGSRIKHRETLRKEFEAKIYRCRGENLRQDAIIRHVNRVDNYPNVDEEGDGISSWFRVALIDTYERGIIVCLRTGGLMKRDDSFRFVDYINGEKQDIIAWLMGDIPFDSIVTVNMEGDKYYYFPHIYCYFDFSEGPYERLWFCEKIDQSHGHPYFRPIVDYEEVMVNNPEGTLHFR